MPRQQLHWLRLGVVGRSGMEAARGAAGRQTFVLRRGAVGHDCAPLIASPKKFPI